MVASKPQGWMERVRQEMGTDRPVIIEPGCGRRPRMEIYCDRREEADGLVRSFGGSVHSLSNDQWQPTPGNARGKPISMGSKLLVTAWPGELAGLRSAHPRKQVLCIPAAMAFGTGEHATTAMCLRLLAEASRRHGAAAWDLLDLGTGSGILALAGILLGAKRAVGFDNDADAVRIAKENARLNGLKPGTVRFSRADLLRWVRPAGRQWPVVTANLFSELLIRLLPEIIAPGLSPGGDAILSGVLAEQAPEVQRAIGRSGLELIEVKKRGRWRAFHCRSDPR